MLPVARKKRAVAVALAATVATLAWRRSSRSRRRPPPVRSVLVTVNGSTVTVAPTDEQGRTFDVHTYNFR